VTSVSPDYGILPVVRLDHETELALDMAYLTRVLDKGLSATNRQRGIVRRNIEFRADLDKTSCDYYPAMRELIRIDTV
jgi:hypothetical protein